MSYFPVSGVESVAGKTGAVELDTPDVHRVQPGDYVMGTIGGQGADVSWQELILAESPNEFSVPWRGVGGLFRVGVPTLAAHPAQLQSLRNATTSKPEIMALTGASTAAQIVTALQAAFTP